MSEYTINRGEGACGLLKCSHVTRRRDRHAELLYMVSLALVGQSLTLSTVHYRGLYSKANQGFMEVMGSLHQ